MSHSAENTALSQRFMIGLNPWTCLKKQMLELYLTFIDSESVAYSWNEYTFKIKKKIYKTPKF